MATADAGIVGRSATELAALVARREVSSREVVSAFVERIEAVNPAINAVTLVLAEQALANAEEADRHQPSGPLHGVPITVKENIDLFGTPTTNGVAALAGAMPSADAPIVQRLRAAGAIPIGRTNLPELGLRLDTDNPLRGRTRNPWDHQRTAGGSSGGEGAAIASRMSPLGLGNDIGGSLRNPAFCCGVVGLRPTKGRLPTVTSVMPTEEPLCGQLMATEGPMGSSVADVALALAILNGAHPLDPTSVDVALERPAGPKVAGVWRSCLMGDLSPAVAAAVDRAADALRADGWDVHDVEVPSFDLVNEVWMRIMADDIPGLVAAVGPMITPRLVDVLLDHVTFYDTARIDRMALYPMRHALMKAWSDMFERTPVVVGPVWPEQAFAADADLSGGIEFVARFLQFVTPAPLLGLPAVAVPTGVVDGLPVGVQVHADRWNDLACLRAARVIEAAVGRTASPV